MKIFGYIFYAIIILTIICCMISPSIQTSLALDEYYSIIYTTTIQPQGEEEIQQIVAEVRNISNTSKKLDAIAAWETKNFTEIFWEDDLGRDLSIKKLDPSLGRWTYESTGKIRPMNSPYARNPYANDPVWIAYYRFGACGELAHLFAEVANRSGFETRLVVAKLKNPTNNHAWVEIKVDDAWWYYDPTVYGQYYLLDQQGFKDRWFRPIEKYDIFSPDRVEGVYFESNNSDMKYRYPLLVSPPPHVNTIEQTIDAVMKYWNIDLRCRPTIK